MCFVCEQTPCDDRCPYTVPQTVYPCAECGEAILSGEEYVEIDGAAYHVACLADKPVQDVLEICGFYCDTARLN